MSRTSAARVLAALLWLGLPLPARAFDGAFLAIPGGAWDVEQGPVEYVLEPNGSDDIRDGSDLNAIRDAFRAWECVSGTKLRFVEGEGPGPADIDDSDGKNTLFWDETGAFRLGPATLGVTVGSAGGGSRSFADIVFNGRDVQWSTNGGPGADVQSIALHEIGHFIGLDHPCDRSGGGGETNCNGSDRTVMTPVWSGELERSPKRDDEEGVRALYPAEADDGSTCDGPFRKGERCSCDEECVEGLVCASAGGPRVCAERCRSDDASCGAGFGCVLDLPDGDEPAPGVCVKIEGDGLPAGAVCASGRDCASGTCALLFDLARSLCQEPCGDDTDCSVGRCYEGFCLGAAVHESCDEPAPPSCGCASSAPSSPGAQLVLALLAPGLLAALAARRRRRVHP
jgi:MYXO-CTERM domain-containing protein